MSECGCDTATSTGLMPIDEALELLLSSAKPLTATEVLPLHQARGRILAKDIVSHIQVPPADNSAMDGYAFRSEDVADAVEYRFPISQRIPAGTMGKPLEAGTAARIFTGAPIPANADTVVMQELCTVADYHVQVTGPVSAGKNVRHAGEDIDIGDTILSKGIKIKPQDMALIASIGQSEVTVFKRLRVGLFFTGDELREPGETLEAGQIYNSNKFTMMGLLENLHCEVIDLGVVEDTPEATKKAMLKATEVADLVMTSGGVSVGEEDYIRIALEELGQLTLWRIDIKPGKPLAFGQIGDTPFLGMPGNPVSVFATFCVFARPFILKKQGAAETTANSFRVPSAFVKEKAGTRHEYARARMQAGAVTIYSHQGSGVMSSTSWANGFVSIPAGITIDTGDLVEFIPFSELAI